jgi:hypothetical protein
MIRRSEEFNERRSRSKYCGESSGLCKAHEWWVAPVPLTFSIQDEGATGPSLLGTGDKSVILFYRAGGPSLGSLFKAR